ncbi:MAG: hypothetical protein CVT65_03795 [Actinobacteria bacterium HGW-Actinobacteria-5]|nr:MAG: hypothetical protein CVT65_03795 [Actinobacteria bacterium HGW-Actinobacteria-5]
MIQRRSDEVRDGRSIAIRSSRPFSFEAVGQCVDARDGCLCGLCASVQRFGCDVGQRSRDASPERQAERLPQLLQSIHHGQRRRFPIGQPLDLSLCDMCSLGHPETSGMRIEVHGALIPCIARQLHHVRLCRLHPLQQLGQPCGRIGDQVGVGFGSGLCVPLIARNSLIGFEIADCVSSLRLDHIPVQLIHRVPRIVPGCFPRSRCCRLECGLDHGQVSAHGRLQTKDQHSEPVTNAAPMVFDG